MYWVKNEDGTFEVLDGQQRTISICEYVAGNFSLDYQYFHNLEDEEKERILNYKLMIYFCEGENREKLDWFKIINIAGEKLTGRLTSLLGYTPNSKTLSPGLQMPNKPIFINEYYKLFSY